MRRLPIALVLLLLAPAVLAQVYKWTDAHGTVHYSEAPPPQGTAFKRITPTAGQPAAPAPPPAEQADALPAATPADASPLPDTPENRTKLCGSLKANLDLLNGKGAVVMERQGKPVTLDDTQRSQQTALAQKQYQQYCGQ